MVSVHGDRIDRAPARGEDADVENGLGNDQHARNIGRPAEAAPVAPDEPGVVGRITIAAAIAAVHDAYIPPEIKK